jgi:thymidylate synthase (FAD)
VSEIVTEPSVYVVGRQQVDAGELDRFLADHGVSWQSDSEVAAEVLTETAGRVCYLSFAKPRPGGNAAYLGHIKEVGHGSVLEHAVWNLLVTGVSRSLTHELVRHRAGFGYSQLSQRYVDESVAEYVVPPDLAEEWVHAETRIQSCPGMDHSPENAAVFYTEEECIGAVWIDAVRTAHEAYERISNYLTEKAQARGMSGTDARKFARQAARSVLPNATETKIFLTGNARALRHFLEMRGSRHAEPEIRKLAAAILDVLVKESPHLFGDYRKEPLPDGTFEITTDYRKV